MKKLIIIKTGDTFPDVEKELGNFEQWIIKGLGVDREMTAVMDAPKGEGLPSSESCKGVVITGSHAMVTQNFSWSVGIEKWIPGIIDSNIPVLGICYGHQLLAKAMGGIVDYHSQGLEIGIREIKLLPEASFDKLFNGMPKKFHAHVCHSQTIVRLPKTAVRLAENDFESTHAFRIGQTAWGIQFHPEYDDRIMAAYARGMQEAIINSGQVLSKILDNICPTPAALDILKRFGKLVG